jgi:hypothetical protein
MGFLIRIPRATTTKWRAHEMGGASRLRRLRNRFRNAEAAKRRRQEIGGPRDWKAARGG